MPDPERVHHEHKMRSNISYYPFTKKQLIQAGEPYFIHKIESYVEFVRFLTDNFEMNRTEADDLAEDCVYATKVGESPNDVVKFLGETLELNDIEILGELMDRVVYLMNNTREWFLKGYTSTELFEEERKHLQPLPETKHIQNVPQKQQKIGRNEPCPCGSRNIRSLLSMKHFQ